MSISTLYTWEAPSFAPAPQDSSIGLVWDVDAITTLREFNELKSNWDDIYAEDKEADYFLSWDWFSQLFETRDDDIFILAARPQQESSTGSEGHNLYCAFLPLRKEVRYSASRKCFFNAYAMAGNYWADSTGILSIPQYDSPAIAALLSALRTLPWQRLLLECLRLSPNRQSLLLDQIDSSRYSVRERFPKDNNDETDLSVCPVITLPDSYDSYLQQLSASTRQKIRRMWRKLDADPTMQIGLVQTEELDQCLIYFRQYWLSRWSDTKGKSAALLAEKYVQLIKSGIQSDSMVLPVVCCDDKPVAMVACYADDVKRTLLFFVGARDPEFNQLPLGLLLHTFCAQWAIERGYESYDLLRGDEPYKYSLGAADRTLKNFVVHNLEPEPACRLLDDSLVSKTLSRMAKIQSSLERPEIHSLYSQMLESWPDNRDVLKAYSHWLWSTDQTAHANEIRQHLAGD